MNTKVIAETGWASVTAKADFPSVVQRLLGAGVQSYVVDLSRRETSYLGADGETQREPLCVEPLGAPADRFDLDGVRAAIGAAQRRELDYVEFLRRIVRAGCCGYHAFLEGRQVLYLGRRGESHVERFPGAA